MKYISLNWTLALKIFNWKEKENARLPNTYGARLYIITTSIMTIDIVLLYTNEIKFSWVN